MAILSKVVDTMGEPELSWLEFCF